MGAFRLVADQHCFFIFDRKETATEIDILVSAKNESETVLSVSAENENEIECTL